ncbi:MAG: hypothetical protein RLZZ450_2318 [Pseudomonadota bacterium]|jgi:hypothetical protein
MASRMTHVRRLLMRSIGLIMIFGLSLSPHAASAQSVPCADLVAKLANLKTKLLPGGFAGVFELNVRAGGAITFVRENSGTPGIHYGLLVNRSTSTVPPTQPGAITFNMGLGREATFAADAVSGPARLLLERPDFDDMAFAISPRTGALQWSNLKWGGGVGGVTTTICTEVGKVVLPAAEFVRGTTTTERTVPIMQVDAILQKPGYGSDSFRLLLLPELVFQQG